MNPSVDAVVRDTRNWLERAVIGLNLCPFAKAVLAKGQVHFAVSAASGGRELLDDLAIELDALYSLDSSLRDTTLLVAPHCLRDFLEFHDFMGRGDRLVLNRGFSGVIQLASFHPDYQFAGTGPQDIANFTNRSPYPTVHLLREASVERAIKAFPEPQAIYDANILTLQGLGHAGWAALGVGPSR